MTKALHTVPVVGASLVAETQGQGNPLVLVHGFADDRQTWNNVSGELCCGRQIIRYDLRGYGESEEHGDAPFRHAHDLLHVLDRLKIGQCDLLGVSMGGSISLNFALDYPERVSRLILISPGLVGWEWSEEWKDLWARISSTARSGDMAKARDLWLNHPIFEKARRNPPTAEYIKDSVARYSGRHWISDNEEPAYPDLDRLVTLKIPTLLLTAACDLPDFRLIADLIAAAVPNVRRVDIQNAGHVLHLECPDEIVSRVSRFVDSPRNLLAKR